LSGYWLDIIKVSQPNTNHSLHWKPKLTNDVAPPAIQFLLFL